MREQEQRTWLGSPVTKATFLTPAYVAVVVLSAAPIIHFGRVDWWWLAPAGGIALVLAAARTGGAAYADTTRLMLCGWVMWAGGWAGMAAWDAMWGESGRKLMLLMWGAGFAATLTLWPLARRRQIAHERRYFDFTANHSYDLARLGRRSDKEIWEAIFASLTRDAGIEFLKLSRHDAGRSVFLRLPATGKITFADVRLVIPNLEVALAQIGIKPSPGAVSMELVRDGHGQLSSRDFAVHINEHGLRSGTLVLPAEHEPLTVSDRIRVGRYRDGPGKTIAIRERNILVIGQTGDGKSNFLTVLNHELTRRTDAAVWVIDFKGGATTRAMLRPWLEDAVHPHSGQPVKRPVLDWVAVDPYEALRMMRTFVQIMETRSFRRRGTKHEPSARHPHIVLEIEEASLVVGRNAAFATLAAELGILETKGSTVCRSDAGTIVKLSQRNTVTMSGSGDAMPNYKTRVGLGADSQQDARMIFPKSQNLAELTKQLAEPGAALIAEGTPDDRDMIVDVFFAGDGDAYDRMCYETGLWHGNIVPGLTRGTPEYEIACRNGYADRWTDTQRMGWVHGAHLGPWIGRPLGAHGAGPQDGTVSLTGKLAALQAGTLSKRDIQQAAGDEFTAKTILATRSGDLGSDEATERSNITKMLAVIGSMGVNGATARELADAMIAAGHLSTANEKQLFRWLKQAIESGKAIQPAGRGGRYYLP